MKKVILTIVLLFTTSLLAQRTVSMNFDLYQNAANNIIAMEGNFPLIYYGTIGSWSYYFELEQPTVEFSQNFMKMIAVLKINTTPTGYQELELHPSIYVNYSLSTDNVTAFLLNFPYYINTTFPWIPQEIRNKIIEYYQTLGLEIYPAKLLDYAESFIPDFLAVEVSNISFEPIQSLPGKLQIVITFDVTGIPPDYKCYTFNKTYAKITSNVSADVKRLRLISGLGQVFSDFVGTMHIQKGGEAVFNIYHKNNVINYQSGRKIIAFLQSNVRGTFIRVYNAEYMPENNQWSDPKLHISTFD